MNIAGNVFIISQLYVHGTDGLVYAGYNAITKQEGISSLDRYRCAESHVGFEYMGHLLQSDGVCTAVQYGWSGVVPPGAEYLKKSWNCNVFDNPMKIYHESTSDFVKYKTTIPGEMVPGSSIEVEFLPQDPWNQIALNIYDDSENDIIFHVSFRKDFNKIQFNYKLAGKWMDNQNSNGVGITSGRVAKLTVKMLADAFKVFVDDDERYKYTAILSPSLARIVQFKVQSGSNCLLKSICVKDL